MMLAGSPCSGSRLVVALSAESLTEMEQQEWRPEEGQMVVAAAAAEGEAAEDVDGEGVGR